MNRKRIIKTLFILLVIGFIFRGWIYRKVVEYRPINERQNYIASNDKLIGYIEENNIKAKTPKIKETINISLSMTSTLLEFTKSENYRNPNNLIETKTANCIGYAAFFATCCNYLLNNYSLADEWIAIPIKGKLYLCGVNIHKYFNSPFFKDHDFVIIKNKKTGELFAVDPSVHDYLGVKYVKVMKN